MNASPQSDLTQIKKELREKANADKAKFFASYFETGAGEYGEGDVFLGITVPQGRAIAKKHDDRSLAFIEKLLQSRIHEERAVALIILESCFKKRNIQTREKI